MQIKSRFLHRIISTPSITPPITLTIGNLESSPHLATWFHRVQTGIRPVNYTLYIPRSMKISGYVDTIQEKSMRFGKDLYPHPYEKMLQIGKFGVLCAMTYYMLPEKELQIAADWITTLFCLDDELDNPGSEIGKDPARIALRNTRKIEIFEGSPLDPTSNEIDNHPLIKAFATIYGRIYTHLQKSLRVIPANIFEKMTYFRTSLDQYLGSTAGEAFNRRNGAPEEEEYLQERYYTGGAINAFAINFLLQGIDIAEIESHHPEIPIMIRVASDAVGLSNDLYSFPKEWADLKKECTDASQEEALSRVYNNLVLLKYKELSGSEPETALQNAVTLVAQLHNKKIIAFYKNKDKLMSQLGLEPDPKIVKAIEAVEAWLFGNPLWSVLNARYNKIDRLISLDQIRSIPDIGTKIQHEFHFAPLSRDNSGTISPPVLNDHLH
jgi:hypothetical protein